MRGHGLWVVSGALVTVTSCSALTSLDGLSGGTQQQQVEAGSGGGPGSSLEDGGPDATAPKTTRTWRRVDVVGPSARHSMRMVYDESRQKVVLVGGQDRTAPLSDTWEWDGTTWARVATDGIGGQRMAGLAYDSDRNVTMLFGGTNSHAAPMAWNGTQWTTSTSNAGPPTVYAPGLVYDSARKVLVLFGGYRQAADQDTNETWEWSPTIGFSQRMPPVAPSRRTAHAMVYDTARSRTVVFGGSFDNGPSNELWEYDGTTWTQRLASPAPSPRVSPCGAYDSVRKMTVLFGGRVEKETSLSDTWEWDGTTWKAGPSGPPARRSCAMAFDKARNAVVMFSGSAGRKNNEAVGLDDTWVYE